jgi:hypothetical protein
MENLHQLKNMKINKCEGTERLMIRNVPELQEVTRSAVVVGEVGTTTPGFLAAAPFAIHVAMQ